MIWIGILIGWVFGALAQWFYFAKRSGLHRTRGEFYLARGIGDEAIHILCEGVRKETIVHFNRKIKPPRSAPPAPPRRST